MPTCCFPGNFWTHRLSAREKVTLGNGCNCYYLILILFRIIFFEILKIFFIFSNYKENCYELLPTVTALKTLDI
jgi:hypothetical protein